MNMIRAQRSLVFYRSTGILFLKKVIMNSIGKLVLKVNPREEMPSDFVGQAVHFFLVFVTASIGYFCISRGYHGGAILMGFMIFLNIGLVLMQHMNRIRITRAIAALKKRHQRQIY
jgi:hypothetical protein